MILLEVQRGVLLSKLLSHVKQHSHATVIRLWRIAHFASLDLRFSLEILFAHGETRNISTWQGFERNEVVTFDTGQLSVGTMRFSASVRSDELGRV